MKAVLGFRARDAVEMWTPASRATSFNVDRIDDTLVSRLFVAQLPGRALRPTGTRAVCAAQPKIRYYKRLRSDQNR